MLSQWTVDGIYTAAVEHARQEDRELDIKDFWYLADGQWPSVAPTSIADLAARAKQYHILDRSIAKYAVNRDEMNVAASIRRVEIAKRHREFGILNSEDSMSLLQWACKTNLMFLAREMFD